MSVSTLTLALSTFSQHGYRAQDVGKSHPQFYHVFYNKEGARRVMLVPKQCNDLPKLQKEIGVLLTRSAESQLENGHKDMK